MLIDDSENSDSIQNVSYLIPIGICIYTIISSFRGLLNSGLAEMGYQYEFDPYLTYWTAHLGTILLTAFVSYFFVRRIWRRILTGEFNCARLFVSLLIITVVSISIELFGHYLLRKLMDLRNDYGFRYESGYLEFLNKISAYVWIVEYVILITVITLAIRIPRKAYST